MTTSPLESLAALDWQPACQCHKHPCPNPATTIVETHAVDHCNDDDLTADGNTVQVLCDQCVTVLRAYVAETLRRLAGLGLPACLTCGAPMVAVGDVVRAQEKL
jgi:hypothetical protein